MHNKAKLAVTFSIIITMVLLILVPVLGSMDGMYMDPLTTPEEFLNNQPHQQTTLFGNTYWFTQPSSTGMVMALGILTILIGLFFAIKKNGQKSRFYWGISLILWGFAAILAGCSYQAFGYELKANGQEHVLFTSWFEIFYMIVQAYSTAFMVSAVGYSTNSSEKFRDGLNVYSSVFAGVYTLIMLIGVLTKNTFLISYTGFIVFAGYNYLIMFILSVIHYVKHHDKQNLYMIILWISFLFVNIFYFVHLYATNSVENWLNGGVWFTENDTLHVLLIAWMIEIFILLKNKLEDQKQIEKLE